MPLYRLRTRKGREVPVEAGFCYHAESGRMVICRFPSGFRAMLPVAAVRAHYADPDANKPTRIAAPADELEPARQKPRPDDTLVYPRFIAAARSSGGISSTAYRSAVRGMTSRRASTNAWTSSR